ncbi:LysR family transcriptional regulator [Pectobacterium brasiliense]|uniref:LysR family transcriptional regulator n=1 Tax=Pectobacterium brasiliense TaxID=180957 RepID=UPI0015DF45FD|nr:LysR family transcriptional regulator [Pectobacterium brasiliense]MBA0212702.1 LysR family transcriptional regulator [Pectobacterium brasiliense]
MDKFDAIRVFLAIVEYGSFSKAAREEGITQSYVSKQIAYLEKWLNVQLFRRTTRQIKLTSEGELLYAHSLNIKSEVELLKYSLKTEKSVPEGTLRISVSPGFGQVFILPYLTELLAKYPKLDIDLMVSVRQIDLINNDVDMVIRHDLLKDSSLIQRKISEGCYISVASPEYIERHGIPSHPDELVNFQCIGFNGGEKIYPWVYYDKEKNKIKVNPCLRFITNDPEHIHSAAIHGLGIAYVPDWLVKDDISDGRLVRIMHDYSTESVPITALYRHEINKLPSIKTFIDFLIPLVTGRLPEH